MPGVREGSRQTGVREGLPDQAILKQGLAEGPLRRLLQSSRDKLMAGWTRVQKQSWGLGSGYIAKEDLIGFADGLGGECKMKRLSLVKE